MNDGAEVRSELTSARVVVLSDAEGGPRAEETAIAGLEALALLGADSRYS